MTDLSRDPFDASFDRFTIPGEIPDAAYWAGNATLEEAQARAAAARREDAAARGYTPSHPAGRGWVPDSRDSGLPLERRAYPRFTHEGVEHVFAGGTPADLIEKIGAGEVFTRERRVRFLDNLAFKGNVRAAAALVGISHETAYRARRRDALFARLWDAAMVHARAYAESVTATRAIDGVELPIVLRGEVVGYRTVHDVRWMNAHLARLDKRVAEDAAAVQAAADFDPLLAHYAGHEPPEGFAEAAGLWDQDRWERAPDEKGLPTREEYVAWYAGEAANRVSAKKADRVMAAAEIEAGAAWDAWHAGVSATLDAIVEAPLPLAGGAGGGPVTEATEAAESPTPNPSREREGDLAPLELKSWDPPKPASRQCVTPVNPPARRHRLALLQTAASPAAHSPYIRGVTV